MFDTYFRFYAHIYLQRSNNPGGKSRNMDQKPPLPMTPFDRIVTTEELQMMKLFLPYLPSGVQRMFALFIKFTELKNTMEYFRRFSRISGSRAGISPHLSAQDMAEELRPYMQAEDAQNLDMALSAMSMMEMMQSSAGSGTNPADLMKNMMTSEQQEMFDLYQTMFMEGDEKNGCQEQSMEQMDGQSTDAEA